MLTKAWSCKIDKEQFERVRLIAQQRTVRTTRHVSIASLVREAVAEWLVREDWKEGDQVESLSGRRPSSR